MSSEQRLSDILGEFARTMVTDFPIQSILDRLVESIVDILPITSAGVTLISPGAMPRYVAASDDSALCFEELQTELGEGPCLAAYHTGEAVAVSDLRGETRFPNFAPRALVAGLAAVFTFPLRHGDAQLGALDLYRDSPGTLSHKAMTDAQTLADVAAAYLLNAQGRADLLDSSQRARDASLHDALTGLANRTLILERLEHAALRDQCSGKTTAVLFIDLDRFKEVNDTYGHRIGDETLIAVSKRLVGLLRPGDTAARLGGDEFVVLLEDLEAPSQTAAIATRVKAALARPFVVSGIEVYMTASVGVAIGKDSGRAGEWLLDDADVAMYKAKRKNGHDHEFLNLHKQHLTEHHVGLECDLHWALGRGELHTEYQPIVAAASGRITGVEALLRWMHPTHGLVSPTTLIPLAENSGLIAEIGQWVLEQAWADLHRWQGQSGDDLAMSVNVSAHQLMLAGFAASVAAVLATDHADARLLTLEMTENVFVRDSERALVVLNDLKDIGVMLAIDDFGTGYSSLSYLGQFPVDIVKLDRSFVADFERIVASHTIVSAVVQLAHDLDMTVVAEGVETAEQHLEVTRLGCDSCQGFYFARPMGAPNLETLMQDRVGGADLRLPVGVGASFT
jgi:diguanylate cyclase (GGDEF)-like protein